ncbi:MAG: hypothetical protein WC880_05240 [Candidatus Paceibacterota bacterium]
MHISRRDDADGVEDCVDKAEKNKAIIGVSSFVGELEVLDM